MATVLFSLCLYNIGVDYRLNKAVRSFKVYEGKLLSARSFYITNSGNTLNIKYVLYFKTLLFF